MRWGSGDADGLEGLEAGCAAHLRPVSDRSSGGRSNRGEQEEDGGHKGGEARARAGGRRKRLAQHRRRAPELTALPTPPLPTLSAAQPGLVDEMRPPQYSFVGCYAPAELGGTAAGDTVAESLQEGPGGSLQRVGLVLNRTDGGNHWVHLEAMIEYSPEVGRAPAVG